MSIPVDEDYIAEVKAEVEAYLERYERDLAQGSEGEVQIRDIAGYMPDKARKLAIKAWEDGDLVVVRNPDYPVEDVVRTWIDEYIPGSWPDGEAESSPAEFVREAFDERFVDEEILNVVFRYKGGTYYGDEDLSEAIMESRN